MKILVDEREIYVPDEMIDEIAGSLWTLFDDAYMGLDDTIRFGMKVFMRETLKRLEKQYGLAVRPPKGEDPVMHLMSLLLTFSMEVIKAHASLEVRTSDALDSIAESLAVSIESEGKSWRQVVDYRDHGMRENDFLEEVTSASGDTLSDIEIIRTR